MTVFLGGMCQRKAVALNAPETLSAKCLIEARLGKLVGKMLLKAFRLRLLLMMATALVDWGR